MSTKTLESLYSIVQQDCGVCHVFRHGDSDEDSGISVGGLNIHQAKDVAIALAEAESRGRVRMLQYMRAFINKSEDKYYEQARPSDSETS